MLDAAPNVEFNPNEAASWPLERTTPAAKLRIVLRDRNIRVNWQAAHQGGAGVPERTAIDYVSFPRPLRFSYCALSVGSVTPQPLPCDLSFMVSTDSRAILRGVKVGLLIAAVLGTGAGIAVMVFLIWALWPKAPNGMKAVKCPRCNATQNIAKTNQTFECWRCNQKSPAAENATTPAA